MTNLEDLNLSHNHLCGTIPVEIKRLVHLKTLSLSNNLLCGPIPSQLCQILSLEHLSLSHNPICGEIPEELRALKITVSIEGTLLYQESVPIGSSTRGRLFPVRTAWQLGLTHPQLVTVLSNDEKAMGMAEWILDRTTEARLKDYTIVHQFDSRSPWRFWIPLCHWLMGATWPTSLDQCWKDVPKPLVKQLVCTAAIVLVEPFHGNVLHLLAYFDLDEDHLPSTNLPVSLIKQHDRFQRTPVKITQARKSIFESRCAKFLRQKELELVVDQQAVQERLQLEQKEEETLLRQQLQLTARTRPSSAMGAIFQLQRALKKYLPMVTKRSTLAQLKNCIRRLVMVADVHWLGHRSRNLEDAAQSQVMGKRKSLAGKLSPLRLLGSKQPERVVVLRTLCSELENHLSQPLIQQILDRQASQSYNHVLQWCRQHPKSPAQGTWLHDVDLGSVLLTSEAARHLLPRTELTKQVEGGHHVIFAYGGMHFKVLRDNHSVHANLRPGLPGVEFMVDRLAKLVIGHGTAPSRLIKLMRDDREVVMQAVRTVDGTTLDWILDRHPHLIARLDSINISDMVLLGMLTNRTDGKPENYIVEMEYVTTEEGERDVKSLHLVSIDNDMAFGKPVFLVNQANNEYATEVRDVVYLLPSMDEPIASASRDRFLQLAPDLTCLQWLSALAARNRKYESMQMEGIFSQEELTGDPRQPHELGLQLPIRLPRSCITQIYNTMVKIQDRLRSHPQSTLHEIFAHVEPALADLYYRTRSSGKPINEQMLDVYNQSMKYIVGDQGIQKLQVAMPNEQHTMYSKMIYHSQLVRARQVSPLTIEQSVAKLLLLMDVTRIDMLLQSGVFAHVPLPDSTELMHLLLSKKLLTRAFFAFLRKRGASVSSASSMEGCYPVQLALRAPVPWIVDLIRDLVEAGSPIDRDCELGCTNTILHQNVLDEQTRKQIRAIFQRQAAVMEHMERQFHLM